MISLIIAETQRLWFRRITWLYPLIQLVLILGGVVIAFFVIRNDVPQFSFADEALGFDGTVALYDPIAGLLPVMGFVIGASYIGADMKTGMLEQILTWEPRRLNVIAARLVGALSTLAVVGAAVALAFLAMIFMLGATAGTTEGTTAGLMRTLVFSGCRLGLATGIFAMIGVAMTTLLKSSVGSIVGFLVYAFIGESLLAVFLPVVGVWLPVNNAAAFGSGANVTRIDGDVFSSQGPDGFDEIVHHGYLAAGLVTVAFMVVAVVLGVAAFARRDIDE